MEIECYLRVTVNTREEADKIQQAVYSGLAAELVRIGVLYGQVPFGGAVSFGTAPTPNSSVKSEVKKREMEMGLKQVETKVGKPVEQASAVEVKKPTGLAGRKRMRRV